ncbi:hypothetical protein [Aestuariivivens sediminis]|uniref:hypothetical protein n=1 Tax=Aestuariivivens sediminis TaxID=2913557 RepID=UPI001F560142|nr:hypothetical protein [Aestuariivivens sediminis]
MKKVIFVLVFIMTVSLSAQTVFTTKTGEKYHKSTCHYLKYSKKEITLEKAKELNYMACSVCKPGHSKTEITTKASSLTNTSSIKKTTATQCTGKTQSGRRCKRMTKNSSGRCYQH